MRRRGVRSAGQLAVSGLRGLQERPRRHHDACERLRLGYEFSIGPVIASDAARGEVGVAAVRHLPLQHALHGGVQIAVDEPGVVKQRQQLRPRRITCAADTSARSPGCCRDTRSARLCLSGLLP